MDAEREREKRWADLLFMGARSHGYTEERARDESDQFLDVLDASRAKAEALAEAAEPVIEHEARRLRIAQDELAFLGKTASPYARAVEKARDTLAAYREGLE